MQETHCSGTQRSRSKDPFTAGLMAFTTVLNPMTTLELAQYRVDIASLKAKGLMSTPQPPVKGPHVRRAETKPRKPYGVRMRKGHTK
jgi:hypothetical protein